MKKRLTIFISSVLVALSMTVAPVHAQELPTQKPITDIIKAEPLPVQKVEKTEEKIEKPVIINADVLKEKEPVIETKKETVAKKADTVKQTETEIKEAETKAATLAAEIAAKKAEVEALRVKVAEKKRVEAEKAEAARLAAVAAPSVGGLGAGEVTAANPNGCNTETQWIRADNKQCKNKNGNSTVASAPAAGAAPVVKRAAVAGNTYEAGQCTWHVKNKRPDLPNNLGNADTWDTKAAAQGLPTGMTARAGAAGVKKSGMHVVYVLEVYANGTMLVDEMNYNYVAYSQRTAIKNQADFSYIY